MSSVVLRVVTEVCRLLPFLLSVSVYLVFGLQPSCPLWFKAFAKCLPLVFLCVYALSYGANERTDNRATKLLAGLTFSIAGDVLRTTSGQLSYMNGEAMFGLAYLVYIWLLGAKPLNPSAGCFLAAVGSLYLLFLSRCLWEEKPMPWSLYAYGALVGTLTWRASAGVFCNQLWSWPQLSASLGGLLFLVSDFTYAVDTLCFRVGGSEALAGVYYAAQMFFTLSVVSRREGTGSPRRE